MYVEKMPHLIAPQKAQSEQESQCIYFKRKECVHGFNLIC